MSVNTSGASQVLIEQQEKDITAMVKQIALQETKINELEADNKALKEALKVALFGKEDKE